MNSANDFTRLFDILPFQAARYPKDVALSGRWHGQWKGYSTFQCIEIIDKISLGLIESGIKPGQKVATLFQNGCPEWNFMDFALQQVGAIVVPIHASSLPKDISHIFRDAHIVLAIVSNKEMTAKVIESDRIGGSKTQMLSIEQVDGLMSWKKLLDSFTPALKAELEERKNKVSPGDLATILYTSGTTGTPKGVMLSHQNIISNIKAILTLVPVNHEKKALSFLPVSHIFERMVVYLYMAAGTSVWYSAEVASLFIDLKEVKPHFITSVPRILEKVYGKIVESMLQRSGLSRWILKWAIHLGLHYDPLERLSPLYWMRLKIIDLVVYRKWRKLLGGKVEGVVVGAASLQPKLARLFCAAGIPVREGYGLTESSPVVSFNHFAPGMYHFGTVGIPIPGVDVKIHEPDEQGQGEIWVKGPNVMKGYFNLPEETASALSDDGWLKTGDVGKFVRRFLKITDRKGDIFKTSSGKFIAPQKVENLLNSSPFIQQSMVVGLNKPFAGALIVPDFNALEKWCEGHSVHWTGPQFMAINPKVEEFMGTVIAGLNAELESHEQVKKFCLLFEEWTMEGGELTFTMKLSRKFINSKFRKEIDGLFEGIAV